MINVVKIGNEWVIKDSNNNILEKFEIDKLIDWEKKLDIINEKIKKYEGR